MTGSMRVARLAVAGLMLLSTPVFAAVRSDAVRAQGDGEGIPSSYIIAGIIVAVMAAGRRLIAWLSQPPEPSSGPVDHEAFDMKNWHVDARRNTGAVPPASPLQAPPVRSFGRRSLD